MNIMAWLIKHRYMLMLVYGLLPSMTAASPYLTVMPVEKLIVLQTKDGHHFISNNGRYLIKGEIFDTWDKKYLKDIEQINYSISHINLSNMGVVHKNLSAITLNNSDQENIQKKENHRRHIYVFIDPLDIHSKQLVKEAISHNNRYAYTFILIPALGNESNRLAKQYACQESKTEWIQAYLKDEIYAGATTDQCNLDNYHYTLQVADALKIKAVPFTITDDDRYRYGYDSDTYWAWIESS